MSNGNINSTFALVDVFLIFTEINRQPHLPGFYLGGKFGEDWWKTAFNLFCVID